MVLASGGQDGAICLWDVLTGSRVSHVYGHRGDITSLVCTTSCVISSGLDDLICIWDRSTGIKLYSIQQVPLTKMYQSQRATNSLILKIKYLYSVKKLENCRSQGSNKYLNNNEILIVVVIKKMTNVTQKKFCLISFRNKKKL